MMQHDCMASLYVWSIFHTRGPSSKAVIRVDVMQKEFLQLCCFHTVHRVSAHDGMFVYVASLYVSSSVHARGPTSEAFTRTNVMQKQFFNCIVSTTSAGFQLALIGK